MAASALNPPPIICRTLRREYRLHLRSDASRELFRFIETDPSIEGVALEPFDIVVEETFGFFSMRLPNGVFTEGTSAHCIGVLHGLLLWDTLQSHEGRPMIHGATVIVEGRRLLIVGEKGAGKSTLVLHLLTNVRQATIKPRLASQAWITIRPGDDEVRSAVAATDRATSCSIRHSASGSCCR